MMTTENVDPKVESAGQGSDLTPGTPEVGDFAISHTGTRDFPCPRCGADLEYHIGHVELHCVHCDYRRKIDLDPDRKIEENDYQQALEQLRNLEQQRRDRADQSATRELIQCPGCSADIVFDESITATECAYCGTPIQRDRIHTDHDRIPVDGVLPYGVDREQAQKSLTRWLKGLWFAPSEFVKRGLRGRFQGVYLPFFTFDSLTFTRFTGQRGDHYTRQVGSGKNRRTVTETRWRRVSGKFQRFFDDVLTLAAREAAHPLLRRLEPWPLDQAHPFAAEFLAGFQARTYDIGLEEAFAEAHQRIQSELRSETRRRIGGDEQRIQSMDTRFDAITYKHVLLPLWLMSYEHAGKTYRVVINATTGKVYGERPFSVVKIALLVAAIIFAVLLFLAVRALLG